MKISHYLLLFMLGLGTALIVAIFIRNPGYMDAAYYYAGGVRLASGEGFSEMILWNYLDDPSGLPHPSHGYWMPLTSIIAAAGMKMLGNLSFSAGRTGFILIAGLLPPVTGAIAYSFTHRKISAFFAGFLAAFTGFYAPFLVTTDSFGIFALLGGVFFLLLGCYSGNMNIKMPRRFLILLSIGVIIGFMHLTRTDGVIWFVVMGSLLVINIIRGILAWLGSQYENRIERWLGLRWLIGDLLIFIIGYLMVMGPWITRNLIVYNSLFPPGGWKVLWLTNYDEIFVYPASILTPTRWLATGLLEITRSRIWALGQNIQTAIAIQGMIVLFPLILLGLWEFRNDLRVRVGVIIWVLVFILMTFFIPFVGARGGFFHAGSALMLFFFVMVPIGLEKFISFGQRVREWKPEKARIGFSIILVVVALFLSIGIIFARVIDINTNDYSWGAGEEIYSSIDQELVEFGIDPEMIVMVNNPPGYTVATGRAAIVIPDGDEKMLMDVAKRYQAAYIIIEPNHPQPLDQFFNSPGHRDGIRYLGTYLSAQLYKVE